MLSVVAASVGWLLPNLAAVLPGLIRQQALTALTSGHSNAWYLLGCRRRATSPA